APAPRHTQESTPTRRTPAAGTQTLTRVLAGLSRWTVRLVLLAHIPATDTATDTEGDDQ
ncbi:MAG: hypothetical protein JWR70_2038, partial [Modestobacter sp.]|nr:hypothetical protein [Modestobacter sp.]